MGAFAEAYCDVMDDRSISPYEFALLVIVIDAGCGPPRIVLSLLRARALPGFEGCGSATCLELKAVDRLDG